MKTGLLIRLALLAALFVGVTSTAHATTGLEMLKLCNQAVKMMDGPKGKFDPIMMAEANYCIGAVEATMAMLALHKDLMTPERAVCVPRISLSQASRLAVKFMENRPDILHMSSGALLYLAFRDSYPCPANGEPADSAGQ